MIIKDILYVDFAEPKTFECSMVLIFFPLLSATFIMEDPEKEYEAYNVQAVYMKWMGMGNFEASSPYFKTSS